MKRRNKKSGKYGKWLLFLLVLLVIGGLLYSWQQRSSQERQQQQQQQQPPSQTQPQEPSKPPAGSGEQVPQSAALQKQLQEEERTGLVKILGLPEVTQGQMVAYIKKRNPQPKLNCTVEELVRYYYEEAGAEGVRPDLALCQAIKETGCWAYGGDVSPEQNNYCGLGATGKKNPGATFATPREGVRAQVQHLLVYATKTRPKKPLVDPRYELVIAKHPEIYGQVTTWSGLDGKWAVPGKHYGEDIQEMLERVKAL